MRPFQGRAIRILAALTCAYLVSSHISATGPVALAQNDYPEDITIGGEEDTSGRNVVLGTLGAMTVYGVVAAATGVGGAAAAGTAATAAAPVTTAPSGGTGIPVPPPVTGDSVWDVARKTQNLTQFARAAEEAGLKDTLRRSTQYTVFAPVNTAFGALDREVLNQLMMDENQAKLADVIGFHVVPGRYTIEQLKTEAAAAGPVGKRLITLNNRTITITNVNGLKINGVPVTETNIESVNGVIHPISGVLQPEL